MLEVRNMRYRLWVGCAAMLPCVMAFADTGDTGVAPDPEEECHDVWQLAVDHLVEADPTLVDPCGTWDPATSYDPNTNACQFFCGEDDHLSVVGGGE